MTYIIFIYVLGCYEFMLIRTSVNQQSYKYTFANGKHFLNEKAEKVILNEDIKSLNKAQLPQSARRIRANKMENESALGVVVFVEVRKLHRKSIYSVDSSLAHSPVDKK